MPGSRDRDAGVTSQIIANFEKMLVAGRDSALLRFGLGNEYFKAADFDSAIPHFFKAVELDADYSAAWKMLGKCLAEAGRTDDARAAYGKGILAAQKKGDKQAAKEMAVFLKRLG
ncbi:MAG: tetratricopeptide repeat protein [Burkholderiales bacterium]